LETDYRNKLREEDNITLDLDITTDGAVNTDNGKGILSQEEIDALLGNISAGTTSGAVKEEKRK
jgi:hypothetical protein